LNGVSAMPIRFEFRPEKFVSALAYLAGACPTLTKMKACKMLFFADKEHLRRLGRPIVGDHYYRLAHGPIPTRGLDMLRGTASASDRALLEKFVVVEGNVIHPRRRPDKRVFSKSDLEVLESTCRAYGSKSAAELRNLSHRERAWVEAEENGPMDYALFFGEDDAEQAMRGLVESEQSSRDAIRPLRA
jgi:uncharacterized phage-associated protein